MKKTALFVILLAAFIYYQFTGKFDSESIKGKNVIITGASTGIGEQLAYQYARLGANIVVTARREHRLKEVVEKCKQEGKQDGQYYLIALDMGDSNSPKQLIEFAENVFGGIDVLVLNHKIPSLGRWLGTPENFTHLHETIDVNFFAYVSVATYAILALEKSNGSIIVLNSVAGKVPSPNLASYSASKHALEGFFGSLRDEFIMTNTDISITMCTLGFIETENAVREMKNFGAERLLNSVKASSASDTALVVIQAGANRLQRVHYPHVGTRIVITLYSFIPESISRGFRYIWERNQ